VLLDAQEPPREEVAERRREVVHRLPRRLPLLRLDELGPAHVAVRLDLRDVLTAPHARLDHRRRDERHRHGEHHDGYDDQEHHRQTLMSTIFPMIHDPSATMIAATTRSSWPAIVWKSGCM